MTTGNNKENPYGDYVPGQYSSGATEQGNGDYSQQANSASSQPNYTQPNYSQPTYGQADYSQQPASYPSYGYDAYGQQVASAPKGLAITSLILGILSFLSGWVVLGGILGIVGLVLGIVALRKTKTGGGGKGLAITGIVFSSLGILISLAMLVFFGWIFSAFGECMAYSQDEVLMEQCINQQLGLDVTDSSSNV
ncbi:DUF4190 domain-containing protein [Rothia sp. 11273D007AR]